MKESRTRAHSRLAGADHRGGRHLRPREHHARRWAAHSARGSAQALSAQAHIP